MLCRLSVYFISLVRYCISEGAEGYWSSGDSIDLTSVACCPREQSTPHTPCLILQCLVTECVQALVQHFSGMNYFIGGLTCTLNHITVQLCCSLSFSLFFLLSLSLSPRVSFPPSTINILTTVTSTSFQRISRSTVLGKPHNSRGEREVGKAGAWR